MQAGVFCGYVARALGVPTPKEALRVVSEPRPSSAAQISSRGSADAAAVPGGGKWSGLRRSPWKRGVISGHGRQGCCRSFMILKF